MKAYNISLCLVVVVAGLAILWLARQPATTAKAPTSVASTSAEQQPPTSDMPLRPPDVTAVPPPADTTAPVPHTVPAVTDAPAKPRYARITIKPGEPIPELFPHQKEREQLHSLAASQDTKHIPTIAQSLRHDDPTVREAARLALSRIGDEAAIPHLEAAAAVAPPPEAELLRETAEFLALPRFMDVLMTHHVRATGANASP